MAASMPFRQHEILHGDAYCDHLDFIGCQKFIFNIKIAEAAIM